MSHDFFTIDNHVHIAGPGDRYPGDFYWHKRFSKGIGFVGLKILKGWFPCKKITDSVMLRMLLKHTRSMKSVDFATVLAFDHVYDIDGQRRGPENGERSTLHVSNRIIDKLCQIEPNLLFGVSVHPFRDDAVEELERYRERAVLCKWMGSAQMIDFCDRRGIAKLDRFFDKLVELKLPLLAHTGVETSIPCCFKERYEMFNRPRFYRAALDRGVTVILAHCGCSYFDYIFKRDDSMRVEALELFNEMARYNLSWNLYADISAIFSLCRMRKNLDEIFRGIPWERLIYGSDFPNPAKGRKEWFTRAFKKFRKKNLFDVYKKKSLKFFIERLHGGQEIFTNFHRLLIDMDRGDIIDRKKRLMQNWVKPPIEDVLVELSRSLA